MRPLAATLLAPLAFVLACDGGPPRNEPPSPPPIVAAGEEPTQDPAPVPPARGTEEPTEPAAVPEASPPASEAPPPTESPAAPDPLQLLEDAQARDAARKVQAAEAERRVAEAEARVVELEKRLLAVRNPFLPRPVLPPEEAKAWEGLDNAERAARVEKQIVEARRDLESAKSALEGLRAR